MCFACNFIQPFMVLPCELYALCLPAVHNFMRPRMTVLQISSGGSLGDVMSWKSFLRSEWRSSNGILLCLTLLAGIPVCLE